MNTQNNKDLRKAFGMFPTGITVVTAIDKENKPIGIYSTINQDKE